jgi:hypothetical protein
MPQYDDDEAFENGVLRDGARHHVRMHMRDSRAPMITDGTDDPLGLHRPGWRIAIGGSERDARLRDSQRNAIEEAHAEYLDRLTNAWKGGAYANMATLGARHWAGWAKDSGRR